MDVGPAALADGSDVPGLVDQRATLLNRGRSLVYHSAPFERDTDIAGFFRFTAWIAIDQPDTDFDVQVWEIRKDGSAIVLAGDRLRARYREGDRTPKAATPSAIARYEFDDFNFTARRLAAGSRLRLVLGPVNSPFDQKNYNSGGVVARETAKDARTVNVTLYHDAEHQSVLSVPVAAPSSIPSAATAGNGQGGVQ
jgi:putative CocE/NonD family hydrolase